MDTLLGIATAFRRGGGGVHHAGAPTNLNSNILTLIEDLFKFRSIIEYLILKLLHRIDEIYYFSAVL